MCRRRAEVLLEVDKVSRDRHPITQHAIPASYGDFKFIDVVVVGEGIQSLGLSRVLGFGGRESEHGCWDRLEPGWTKTGR